MRFNYYDNVGDQRLAEIQHLRRDSSIISQFDYAYDAEGQITTWAKQLGDQPPTVYAFEYDPVGQLLSSMPQTKGAGALPPSQFIYQYDNASNRTSEQIDDGVTLSNYNNLNQLVSQQADILPDPDPVVRRSEVEYDGLGRRVRIVEQEDGMVVSDKRFLWCGFELCEERDATGATVTKRFYGQGVQANGMNYFYTRDHLGSLRELTDAGGAIRARYDYDSYGRRTKVSGDLDADFAFTGHYFHNPSGLHLALYRSYNANLGRWLLRDPLGEIRRVNLYAYVSNDPINKTDLFGLEESVPGYESFPGLTRRLDVLPFNFWQAQRAAREAEGDAARLAAELEAIRSAPDYVPVWQRIWAQKTGSPPSPATISVYNDDLDDGRKEYKVFNSLLRLELWSRALPPPPPPSKFSFVINITGRGRLDVCSGGNQPAPAVPLRVGSHLLDPR
jgi:RHS repeat-associated protein